MSFLPTADAALLAWAENFSDLITSAPTSYGLVAADATAFGLVKTSFADAMAANAPGVRSKATVASKNSARDALKNSARFLADRVQGTPTVTDAQKLELGLTVRATPTPIPAPSVAPDLDLISMIANVAKVRIHDAATTLRRKPAGCVSANVFSYVGATAPTDPNAWKFEGGTTKSIFDVAFDASLTPGTKVWITAQWLNRKALSGPAATPIGAVIQFGGSLPMAA
jgi:hypothetical protein